MHMIGSTLLSAYDYVLEQGAVPLFAPWIGVCRQSKCESGMHE